MCCEGCVRWLEGCVRWYEGCVVEGCVKCGVRAV